MSNKYNKKLANNVTYDRGHEIQKSRAQWSEGVTKLPWSSEQIEVNLSFLDAFGCILNRKVFSNLFKALTIPSNQIQKSKKFSKIRKFGNIVGL